MEIPVPTHKEANDALLQVTGGNFYLGITDNETEGTYKNIYTNREIEFENWRTGEPNNIPGENYVMYFDNYDKNNHGLWNDVRKEITDPLSRFQAICWKKLNKGLKFYIKRELKIINFQK